MFRFLLSSKDESQSFAKQLFSSRMPSNAQSNLASMMKHTASLELAASTDRISVLSHSVCHPLIMLLQSLLHLPRVLALLLLPKPYRVFENRPVKLHGITGKARCHAFSYGCTLPAQSICWYPKKFQDQVEKCTQLCSYFSQHLS